MFSLPNGVLKFAVNASIFLDTSFTNLRKWGKRLLDNCHLCKGKGTLLHILNNCQSMLDRYLWTHNNLIPIFFLLSNNLVYFKNSDIQMYADLENHTIGGGPCHQMLFLRHRNWTLWHIGLLTDESFSLSYQCRLSQTSEMLTAPNLIGIHLNKNQPDSPVKGPSITYQVLWS